MAVNVCNNCGKELNGAFSFCPNCGSKINRFCPKCGEKIIEEGKFCHNCGASLEGNSIDDAISQQQNLQKSGKNSENNSYNFNSPSGSANSTSRETKITPFPVAVKLGFSNIFSIEGRSSRSEYWWYVSVLTILFILQLLSFFILLDEVAFDELIENPTYILVNILIFGTLSYSVTIRRLKDINLAPGILWPFIIVYYFLDFIPLIFSEGSSSESVVNAFDLINGILSFVLIIMTVTKGTTGNNRYGADPLEKNK